jgi:signal transduction histidine kinase
MGEVVAKVNHDMRNVLSSALLVSDRLSYSDDPKQQKSAVIVQKSIDRASTLCRQMNDYIKAPKALKSEWLEITPILRECGEDLSIDMSYEDQKTYTLMAIIFIGCFITLAITPKKQGRINSRSPSIRPKRASSSIMPITARACRKRSNLDFSPLSPPAAWAAPAWGCALPVRRP